MRRESATLQAQERPGYLCFPEPLKLVHNFCKEKSSSHRRPKIGQGDLSQA